jgi:putative copper export protein
LTTAQVVLTWLVVASQLLIFGTAACVLLGEPVGVTATNRPPRNVAALWRGLSLANLAVSPFAFLATASAMADQSWRGVLPFVPQILRDTHAGRVWTWRFGAAVVLAIAAHIPARRNAASLALCAICAALILLASLESHAIDKGHLAVAIYAVHQAAAGLWIGALAWLLLAAARGQEANRSLTQSQSQWLETAAARVSSISGWSVAVLAITGLCTAYRWLGLDLRLLVDSLYGRTLLWKLATASLTLMLGGYNRYRLMPTPPIAAVAKARARVILIRNVAVECVLLLGVLAWSALLADTPPPH